MSKPNWVKSVEALRAQMTPEDMQAMDEYLEHKPSDTEMLSWCNAKMASITYAVPHGWRVWIPFTTTIYHGDTLREAIRAAMKAEALPEQAAAGKGEGS